MKTKLFVEKYILGYRTILRSQGGKGSPLAQAIYIWLKDDLKLELPQSLEKGEKLSFSSLVLDEKIKQRGVITPEFVRQLVNLTEN